MAQGQHPVKWLVETLSVGEGILEALWTWLDEVLPGGIGKPIPNPAASGQEMGQQILLKENTLCSSEQRLQARHN